MVKNFALRRLALCIKLSGKTALETDRVKTLDSCGAWRGVGKEKNLFICLLFAQLYNIVNIYFSFGL